MNYLPLPDNAARQVIDSMTVFGEFRRVKRQVEAYAGSMYWKREGAYELPTKAPRYSRAHRASSTWSFRPLAAWRS
jgi:hypothetical protein